ncbi:hypothetical protein C8R47DRAFT_1132838 [Mycena vitilis]|nr:hypothetical protein C8R47DRAFT_1132838 [Mycena vitilis]
MLEHTRHRTLCLTQRHLQNFGHLSTTTHMGQLNSRTMPIRDLNLSIPDDDSSITCSLLFHSVDELKNSYAEALALTTHQLLSALTSVANILHEQGKSIKIVTIGGAVNTLLLQSRATTSDVDFFYSTHNDNADISNLVRIAESVAKKSSDLTDGQWLNNHTSSFIEASVLKRLYREAVHQNRLVFDSSSLIVYAAPWPFALVQKMLRYSSEERKSYDMDDAIAYLKEMSEPPTSHKTVVDWAKGCRLPVPKEEAYEAIMARYRSESDDGWLNI